MSTCSPSLIRKIVSKRSDPCPPVGKGSYKVANVCHKSPYVYYTPRASKRGFRESIDDLMIPESFDRELRAFFMTPLCILPKGIPKKTDERTVVVNRLTGVLEYMERKPDQLLQTYTDFVRRYIQQIYKMDPSEVWRLVSTDFKPDNLMIDERDERLLITDFTPVRKHEDGFFSYITTPMFVHGDDFNDFKEGKKYTDLQMSEISYHIFILCALTSLFHLISTRNHLTSGYTARDAENQGYQDLNDLFSPKNRTLHSRQQTILRALRKISHAPIDMAVVESWLANTPFRKRKSIIERSRKPSKKGSKTGCTTFLSALKRRSTKAVNPITGRQILKRGPDGKPTALVKKLVNHCQ
jgi:serine/threonine protein kinase